MNVFFYVNGVPRLIMACAIADEYYPNDRKYLILLHQHGYNYEAVLPAVRHKFTAILDLRIRTRRYSHAYQFIHTYLNPYLSLREFFTPESEVVLFDISSPVQKFIVRHNKAFGNTVKVYAESLAVNRCFVPSARNGFWARVGRQIFPRAFGYQHDYDVFHVLIKEIYADTPFAGKLRPISDLYRSRSYAHYGRLLTAHLPLGELSGYDTIFFGQPLSNFDNVMSRDAEVRMLREILGERKTLILPHPNEILDGENKYSPFKNARVFRSGVPNELLLLRLRPKVTMTYFSTIGINYAVANADSVNYLYPIDETRLRMLQKYSRHLPNITVDERFVAARAG